MWRNVKFLAEQLAEILVADPEILRDSVTAVIRDLSAAEQVPGLIEEGAHRWDDGLLPVHIIDRENELLCLEQKSRKPARRRLGEVLIILHAFVQERVRDPGVEDRDLRQESHVQERAVGLIPKTDKKLKPFSILLGDGGVLDIWNTLNKASGIQPGAFFRLCRCKCLPRSGEGGLRSI